MALNFRTFKISTKQLHIVSFDVPFPPNYGGVIDVFYKLKALHELGVKIYLHVFEYGRGKPKELERYCKQVFYYPRYSSIKSIFSKKPYAVKSRSNNLLVLNLKKINAPILFDGLHATSPLIYENFKHRKKIVRAHNIEHLFYDGQSKSERRIDKKLFFKTETIKFKTYEEILHKVDYILTISPFEQQYFSTKFAERSVYIPVFHQNDTIKKISGKGDFALYNGDLRISDNIKSALFLIAIFKDLDYPLILASSFKNELIFNEVIKHKNIDFVLIKDGNHINNLIQSAQMNVLPTFQKTGIKLKLINTLFNGRFCVVTNEMVEDTGLEELCEIGKTKEEFSEKILRLTDKNFDKEFQLQREQALKIFDTKTNAQKIIDLLY